MLKLATFLESWYHCFTTRIAPFAPHHVFALSTTDLPIVQLPRLDQNPLIGQFNHLCHYIAHIRVQEYQPAVHRLRLSASP